MKICKIEPDQNFKIVDIQITLSNLQKEVDGNIEYLNVFNAFRDLCEVWKITGIDYKDFRFMKKYVFIVNEEYLFRDDLKSNGVAFKGNVLLIKELKHDKPSDILEKDINNIKDIYFLFFNMDLDKPYTR